MAAASACPSSRDQRIYFEVRILGTTQDRTAQLFGLTQPRISQIVREVARWHAEQGVEPVEEAVARRRRLADREECERLRNLYELTLAELERQSQPEVERKTGRRGHIEWDEETCRPPRGRVQLLKLARNLVHDLHKVELCVPGPAEEPDDLEEAGDWFQGSEVRVQETAVTSQATYSAVAVADEPASVEAQVAAGDAAASTIAAESCVEVSDQNASGDSGGEAGKNGANMNWPGDAIPQDYRPETRMFLRGARTREAVKAAMRS